MEGERKMPAATKKFNPNDHLTDIKGKPYLPVQWRLVWFREEHPDWTIETQISSQFENGAIMKAQIKDETGKVISQAHKMETKAGFGDYLEKAETGAIGRALGMTGYGTQFSPDLDEGDVRIVDAPISNTTSKATKKPVEASSEPHTGLLASPKQLKFIKDLYAQKELNSEAMTKLLGNKYKVKLHSELTKAQASEWIEHVQGIESGKEEDPLNDAEAIDPFDIPF